ACTASVSNDGPLSDMDVPRLVFKILVLVIAEFYGCWQTMPCRDDVYLRKIYLMMRLMTKIRMANL
ncbi:MAG: hypothetical protein AB8B94_07285, partial [Hyphomicrobiales bacterium]